MEFTDRDRFVLSGLHCHVEDVFSRMGLFFKAQDDDEITHAEELANIFVEKVKEDLAGIDPDNLRELLTDRGHDVLITGWIAFESFTEDAHTYDLEAWQGFLMKDGVTLKDTYIIYRMNW